MTDDEEEDHLAAELALGTLAGAERDQAEERRRSDPAFASAVASWEARLAPLAESVPDLAPPPGLFTKIERRIEGAAARAPVVELDLLRKLRRWRLAAMAGGALAACLALALALASLRPTTSVTFVARLEKNAAAPGFLLTLDPATRTLAVRPVAARVQPGKSFELWLIAPGAPPRPFGLLDPAKESVKTIDVGLRSAEAATWAVSLEPAGGSPTGAPTGPVLFTGRLLPVRS